MTRALQLTFEHNRRRSGTRHPDAKLDLPKLREVIGAIYRDRLNNVRAGERCRLDPDTISRIRNGKSYYKQRAELIKELRASGVEVVL
jgi:hypothetical protein